MGIRAGRPAKPKRPNEISFDVRLIPTLRRGARDFPQRFDRANRCVYPRPCREPPINFFDSLDLDHFFISPAEIRYSRGTWASSRCRHAHRMQWPAAAEKNSIWALSRINGTFSIARWRRPSADRPALDQSNAINKQIRRPTAEFGPPKQDGRLQPAPPFRSSPQFYCTRFLVSPF